MNASEGKLRIIPYYTGEETIEEAIGSKVGRKLLWLEILFNDGIDWGGYLNIPEVKDAHEKACAWYGKFKTMVDGNIKRKPLPTRDEKIDYREYRRFMEALNFVSS